jgi:tellurite resistance protein TehA-like permease
MNYSQKRKNLKGFLGWSGFTLAILGIALMLTGSTMDGTYVQWLGVIVGGIACVLLVSCSFTDVYKKPKKIVHNLYSKEEWKEVEENYNREF